MVDSPNIDTGFDTFDVKQKRGMPKNKTNNNNNNNTNNNAVRGGSSIGQNNNNNNTNSNSDFNNSNNNDDSDENQLRLLRNDIKNKVAKVFVSQTAYSEEKNEVSNIKQFFKEHNTDYNIYFPNVYQCGYVTWKRNNVEAEDNVRTTLSCRKILKGFVPDHGNENIHTLYFIIMDKLEYSLEDVFNKKRGYKKEFRNEKENMVKLVSSLLDLADRMREMHEFGIVHCDIKPQNILADTKGVLYFVDLGGVRHTEAFSKQGSSVRTRRFSIVFTPDDEEAERQFDEDLMYDLDECFKYLVCRLLGIKNISVLIDSFRKLKSSVTSKSAKTKEKDELLLYVDNFALAITFMMFIKQFVEEKAPKRSAFKQLENVTRDLFLNVGSHSIQFSPRDTFTNVRQIQHGCYMSYNTNTTNTRTPARQANNTPAPEMTHSEMMKAFGVM